MGKGVIEIELLLYKQGQRPRTPMTGMIDVKKNVRIIYTNK
jgi:hypothetical protein